MFWIFFCFHTGKLDVIFIMLIHSFPPAFGCQYPIALPVSHGSICVLPSFVQQGHVLDYYVSHKKTVICGPPSAFPDETPQLSIKDFGPYAHARSSPLQKINRYSPYDIHSSPSRQPSKSAVLRSSSNSPILSNLLSKTKRGAERGALSRSSGSSREEKRELLVNCASKNVVHDQHQQTASLSTLSRVLHNTIDFVMRSPWSNKISIGDRLRLFSHCWSELFLISLAEEISSAQKAKGGLERCMQIDTNNPAVAENDPWNNLVWSNNSVKDASDSIGEAQDFLRRCSKMRMTKSEYECMRCAVFFNSGSYLHSFFVSFLTVTEKPPSWTTLIE